jgi:hypothetical protein
LALLDRLRQALRAWEVSPLHASLFGSAARWDGDTSSDIDLFIVRPDHIDAGDARWREQLDSLTVRVYRWTGNRAGIAEVSARDIERLRDEQPAIVGELRADVVNVFGPPVSVLLGDAE